ncbi:MAG: TlpA family protein disulfide reductase [Anaerolineae bacterium]
MNWFGPLFFLGVLLVLLVSLWNGRAPRPASEPGSVAIVETAETFSIANPLPTLPPPPTPEPLETAPDFLLTDLFDETILRKRSDYNGRPLILNFWASWCVPCREEMPALQRAYDEYGPSGLAVLGVNETYIDDLAAAQDFVAELELTFPSVRDDDGKTSDELYRVIGLPTSVFVTPDGEVAYVQIGQMTEEQIQFYSSQLVAGLQRQRPRVSGGLR